MIKKEIEVKVPGGLEARQTALLVQTACGFDSQIYLQYSGKNVNAKSIMGMLSLGISEGGKVTLSIEGNDEAEAAEKIAEFFEG